jgi:hypothetical protein
LRSHVEGRAEDRDIGVDRVPIETRRLLAEGTEADEGQIETPALITVLCHPTPAFLALAVSPRWAYPNWIEGVILSKSETQPKNLKIEAAAKPDLGADLPRFAARAAIRN